MKAIAYLLGSGLLITAFWCCLVPEWHPVALIGGIAGFFLLTPLKKR